MVSCGVAWCVVVWCGMVWCGVVWDGVMWCGVGCCDVVWCGVVCCAVLCCVVMCCVAWRGVVWCGVVLCWDGTECDLFDRYSNLGDAICHLCVQLPVDVINQEECATLRVGQLSGTRQRNLHKLVSIQF